MVKCLDTIRTIIGLKTLSVLLQMSNIRNIGCTYVKYNLDMSDTEYTVINITLNSHERLHSIHFQSC